MTQKSIADRLIEQNDGSPFISIVRLMKILKIGHKAVVELLSDLTPMSRGTGASNRAKYYFADDIANEIMKKGL